MRNLSFISRLPGTRGMKNFRLRNLDCSCIWDQSDFLLLHIADLLFEKTQPPDKMAAKMYLDELQQLPVLTSLRLESGWRLVT